MPCVVAAGSWAPSRPVTDRDSSARRSRPHQPGRAHLLPVTADSLVMAEFSEVGGGF